MSETATHTGARHQAAVAELLASLMRVKGWLHESHRWLHTNHSRASMVGLALLERHAPARVGELAEAARVDVSVISRQLQQLESDGLVEREPDPADRRASLLTLSAAGREVLDTGRARLASLVEERLAGREPEELTAFPTDHPPQQDDLQA
jgi:DNA-binding MarR family transcriptional regulator